MKRLLPLLILSCIVSSCFGSVYDNIRINIDRASKVKTRLSELCSKVEVFPIALVEPFPEESMLLDVTGDFVFILSRDRNQIRVYDSQGDYVTSIKASEKIIDFSTYHNLYLDLLDGNRIVEYNLKDFSITNTLTIPDTELKLLSLIRRDENVFLLSAISKGNAYNCYYAIDLSELFVQDHFYYSKNPFTNAKNYLNSRYFKDNEYLYYYYSQSGVIICASYEYLFPMYDWNWGKYSSSLSISNVQKTMDNLYMRFNIGDEERTLIYNTYYRRYKVIRQTKEGVSFPVGIIHDGVNYYCIHSSELPKYLNPKVKGVEIVGDIEGIGTEDSMVLIKYYLK